MLWMVVIFSLLLQMGKNAHSNSCISYLQSIDCSSRQLAVLPNDLPSETLNAGNAGNPLQPDMTPFFATLNLSNNLLEELPTSLLSERLPHLQSLDLSKNKILEIVSVQSVVLGKQLLHLNLSSNPIRHLGVNIDTVLYSKSISHLDISDCAINSITNPATFMYMMNLTNLDLSGNPLIVIDNLVSPTLSHLDLSHCLLGLNDKGIREETLTNLPKLEFLNLSGNAHLTKFPITKPLSSSLLHLEANFCALEKIELGSFPNLEEAKLRGNVIKTLYNNMFYNNVNLKNLDVSENSIHHIEDNAFVGANSLIKLDLSLNQLSDVNWNVFLHTPRLSSMNISRNLITSLNEIPMPSLISLDASKCDILNISPTVLTKANNLRHLNLSHNSLEKLPKKLKSDKLQILDLSFCRISDLQEETFKELSVLVGLNLMGNRLTGPIKRSLVDHWGNLRELNLLNNPWYCDCHDADFRNIWKYFASHVSNNNYLKSLICHSPKEHSGQSWEKSCFVEHITNNEASRKGAWFSFLVPFLTLCCLLAILVVIRQAYTSHGVELQREANQRAANNSQFVPRVAPHFFDEDLERGIQLSVNDSTQRSPINELSKLPSYEEALLLPKLLNGEDLKKIVTKYEESDRFERSALGDSRPLEDSQSYESDSTSVPNEDSTNNPSTSGNSQR